MQQKGVACCNSQTKNTSFVAPVCFTVMAFILCSVKLTKTNRLCLTKRSRRDKEEISRLHIWNFESDKFFGRKFIFSSPLGLPKFIEFSNFSFIFILYFL